MKNTKENNESRRHLLITLPMLGLAAACSGGGGGGGGGGGDAAQATELGALTTSGQLGAVRADSAEVALRTSIDATGLEGTIGLALDPDSGCFYTQDFNREVLVRIGRDGDYELVGHADALTASLTYDRKDDELFGVSFVNPTRGELWRIDPRSGDAERVGSTINVVSLAHDATSDLLYGTTRSGELYSIDPASGGATLVFQSPVLIGVTGLTFDPVQRFLYATRPSQDALLQIDPGSFAITELATFAGDPEINDIAFDVGSGRTYGLTQNGTLAELAGNWPAGELDAMGVLSRRLASMSFDPADGRYFAVDVFQEQLVKLDARSTRFEEIGSLEGHDIHSLVYDPALRQLHGIDELTGYLVSIDTSDATVTPIPAVEFLYRTRLAIDPTTGTIYGYERERNLSLEVDPNAPSLTILQSAVLETLGLTKSYILDDLTFDPTVGKIVAIGTEREDKGGGSSEFRNILFEFDPRSRGTMNVFTYPEFAGRALGRDADTGLFYAFVPGQPLFEIEVTLGAGNVRREAIRTFDGLWDRDYRGSVLADARETVYAIDSRFVFEVDPVTGSTLLRSGQPTGVSATSVVYDEARDYLGLHDGNQLVWVRASTPFRISDTQTIPPYVVIASDPRFPETIYGVRGGILYRYDLTQSTEMQLTQNPLPGIEEDTATFVPEEFAVYVTTTDQRLFRVDAATGEWTEVGELEFEVLGLYVN